MLVGFVNSDRPLSSPNASYTKMLHQINYNCLWKCRIKNQEQTHTQHFYINHWCCKLVELISIKSLLHKSHYYSPSSSFCFCLQVKSNLTLKLLAEEEQKWNENLVQSKVDIAITDHHNLLTAPLSSSIHLVKQFKWAFNPQNWSVLDDQHAPQWPRLIGVHLFQ